MVRSSRSGGDFSGQSMCALHRLGGVHAHKHTGSSVVHRIGNNGTVVYMSNMLQVKKYTKTDKQGKRQLKYTKTTKHTQNSIGQKSFLDN